MDINNLTSDQLRQIITRYANNPDIIKVCDGCLEIYILDIEYEISKAMAEISKQCRTCKKMLCYSCMEKFKIWPRVSYCSEECQLEHVKLFETNQATSWYS